MKFLALALAVALLFSAGESVADSLLNKQKASAGAAWRNIYHLPLFLLPRHKFEMSPQVSVSAVTGVSPTCLEEPASSP